MLFRMNAKNFYLASFKLTKANKNNERKIEILPGKEINVNL